MKKLLISLLVLSFILPSCSVQKRRYNKGYDINFRKFSSKTVKKGSSSENTTDNPVMDNNIENAPETELLVSALKNDIADVVCKPQKSLIGANDSCDIIYLKNRQIIKAKVIEINKTEIKYKRCDNLSGPIIVIDKKEVKNITYKNGYNEEFNETEENIQSKKTSPDFSKKKERNRSGEYDGFSIASLVCGILGVFIFFTAVPAVICGIIGLKNIRESGDTIKGRVMATVGLVLGVIVILIFLLVLLAILATI